MQAEAKILKIFQDSGMEDPTTMSSNSSTVSGRSSNKRRKSKNTKKKGSNANGRQPGTGNSMLSPSVARAAEASSPVRGRLRPKAVAKEKKVSSLDRVDLLCRSCKRRCCLGCVRTCMLLLFGWLIGNNCKHVIVQVQSRFQALDSIDYDAYDDEGFAEDSNGTSSHQHSNKPPRNVDFSAPQEGTGDPSSAVCYVRAVLCFIYASNGHPVR